MEFDLGHGYEPVKEYRAGAYIARVRKGSDTADVAHSSDPAHVIDTVPVCVAGGIKRALAEWHASVRAGNR